MHILIMLIFSYLILFDIYPLGTTLQSTDNNNKTLFGIIPRMFVSIPVVEMPASEVFILLCMIASTISELREVYNIIL